MKFLKNLTIASLIFISFIPIVSLAGLCPDGVYRDNCQPLNDPAKSKVNTTIVTIENPLGTKGASTIPEFIGKILDFALLIAVPILTLAIVYCGFLFVKAQGNSEALGEAKKALLYTLIGAFILIGAKFIAEAIGSTVKDLGSTAFLFINNFMV